VKNNKAKVRNFHQAKWDEEIIFELDTPGQCGVLTPQIEPEIEQLVHSVNDYKGGQYGFFSAHASTNFAIAIFLIFLFRGRYRWMIPVLLVWASIMAYSRIYLGVHYPGDILAGLIVGGILGCLFAWLTGYVIRYQDRCVTT
jgi:undecaprenyl-diphosphatase